MENTIKIKIFGPQGSGKTRMVEFLTGVLLRDGFVFYHNPHKKVTPIKGPHEEDFRHLFKVGEAKGESLEVLMCSTNATEGEAYRAEADRLLTELKETQQEKNTVEKQITAVVASRNRYLYRELKLSEELEKTNGLMDRLKSDNLRLEEAAKKTKILEKKLRGEIAELGAALNQKDNDLGRTGARVGDFADAVRGALGTPKAKKYRLKPSAEGYMPPYHPGQVYSIDWDPQQDGIAPAHLLIARYPKDWVSIKSEI